MEEIKRYVGMKIKEFRNEKRMTQKDLGKKLGVRDNTISSYESGTNEVSLVMLFHIAKVLGKRIDDFFPPSDVDTEEIQTIIEEGNLQDKDLKLIEEIKRKALQLEDEERKRLLHNIKFAVDFFEKGN